MKRHTALTSTFSYVLDRLCMLSSQSLSKAHREPLRGVARGVLLAFGIALCFPTEAGSTKPKEYIDYKTYSLYLLDWNKDQHKCLLKLYGKESAWNPLAVNGSHYGIPQGRSEYLSRVDGYKQIQWGLKYIHHHRIYQGDVCKALGHWSKYGWH
jgi:hypothetical protein